MSVACPSVSIQGSVCMYRSVDITEFVVGGGPHRDIEVKHMYKLSTIT